MSEHRFIAVEEARIYEGWRVCRVLSSRLGCVIPDAPYIVVPSDALRDAPDDEQLRREIDRLVRELGRVRADRQEARDRVAELERKRDVWREDAKDLVGAERKAVEERDEARREAEELRQERYRLRHELEEAASIAANQPVFAGDIIGKRYVKSLMARGIVRKNRDGDYVLRTPGPECSAPHQTHCVPVRVTSQLTNVPGPWEKLVEIQFPYSVGKTKATIPADMLLSPSHGYDAKEVEDWRRDAAETARLRAENERLRAAGADVRNKLQHALHSESRPLGGGRAVATWDEVAGPVASPDQPATQTHYRENDLVLSSGGAEYRLDELVSAAPGPWEKWFAQKKSVLVCLRKDENPILERDGTPTDEGLRRLAEKAECTVFRHVDPGFGGFGIENRYVWIAQQPTDDDRRALAAALREMGGA